MSTLRDMLENRNKDKIKRESDEFQAKYPSEDSQDPDAVPEKGLEADSFIPNRDSELSKAGWKQAAAPVPPVGETESGTGIVSKLREKGLTDDQIHNIGNELRMGRNYNFRTSNNTPVGTLGRGNTNPAIQELKEFSRNRMNAEYDAAPALDLEAPATQTNAAPKAPKLSGEAQAYYERTGINPKNKPAYETLRELRAKNGNK